MKNSKHSFTAIEKQMIEDIDNNKFHDVSEDEFVEFKYEAEQGTKTKQISLALQASELEKAKARAKPQGFKYQSVFKALIHQYANGKVNL